VPSHIDQLLGAQQARADKALVLDAAVGNQLGSEQVNPLTVGRTRHLAGIAAIATEQLAVARNIEVNGPFVALKVIPGSLARAQVVTGEPEHFSARRL